MLADLIITMAILYGLITSRTGWVHTDRVSIVETTGADEQIITRLMRLTLESQLPPLILAITYTAGFCASASCSPAAKLTTQ